jgi:hypothetical protein
MTVSAELLLNESVLIARAQAEPGAFSAVYSHYSPRVYN